MFELLVAGGAVCDGGDGWGGGYPWTRTQCCCRLAEFSKWPPQLPHRNGGLVRLARKPGSSGPFLLAETAAAELGGTPLLETLILLVFLLLFIEASDVAPGLTECMVMCFFRPSLFLRPAPQTWHV